MGVEKRKHFRIKYPVDVRPFLVLMGKRFQVIDISESGLKFKSLDGAGLKVGSALEGEIDFAQRQKYQFKGTIVRAVGDLLMVQFDQHCPQDVLKKEADYLIERFGEVKTDQY